jgi:hypothetical protein
MKWQQVRLNHPDRWLLVEAAQAHTEADRRILDDLVVLDTYEDSALATTRRCTGPVRTGNCMCCTRLEKR